MRAAAAIAVVLAVAACGQLPQPFRHEGDGDPLVRPRLERAVAVRPLDGTPRAAAVAKAMVDALDRRDIPATIGEDVTGQAQLEAFVETSGGRIEAEWVLSDQEHRVVATHHQTMTMREWATAPAAGLAETVVAALVGPVQALADAAPVRRPTVRLKPPSGLPGDGDSALAVAMRGALERSGVLVVGEGGDYIVEGHAQVTPGRAGEQVLAVSWTLSKAAGASLATVDQKGAVAKGSLDGPWGTLARDVAEGGAAGVLQALPPLGRGRAEDYAR